MSITKKSLLTVNNLPSDSSLLYTKRDPIRTTNRYAPIDHRSVIASLNNRQWFVSEYTQVTPQNKDRAEFVRWLATYQNDSFRPLGREAVPVILHQGSHDGSSSLVLSFAVKNLDTDTLTVVGDLTCPEFSFKHKGPTPDANELDGKIQKAMDEASSIFQHVHQMKSVRLNPQETLQYAKLCTDLRFDPEKYDVNLSDIVNPSAKSLWEQLNCIQDALLKAKTLKVHLKAQDKTRKAKALSHIDASIKIKKQLWNLSIQFCQKVVTA